MKKNKFFNKKTIIGGSVIFIAFLFILMAFSPALAGSGQQTPQAITENSYIPNPTLNSNITWNTFYSSWNELEYSNGTANKTLNTGISTFYKNAISVNPSDIEAYGLLQNDKLGTYAYWNNTSIWSLTGTAGTFGKGTLGNGNTLTFTVGANTTDGTCSTIYTNIPVGDYPSNNLHYDYVTGILTMSGNSITGVSSAFQFWNSTGNGGTFVNSTITPGESIYFSLPLSDLSIGLNTTTGAGYSSYLKMLIAINTPSGAASTDSWTTTISGLGFTDYQIPLGTNSKGAPIVNAINPTMSTFGSTELKYSQVINSGYSVAVSEAMSNITESQTAINDGSYIEQATYQGTLELPTAPGLTYGNANISLNMTLPGNQYEVATLNGVSYLSGVNAKTNGTYVFGTVNPNSPNSMILETKYTSAQWDASTHAPSFFTLRGLEYYWWVGVIAGLSIIGLGAAAISHFGGEEEDLKIPKGKFGR